MVLKGTIVKKAVGSTTFTKKHYRSGLRKIMSTSIKRIQDRNHFYLPLGAGGGGMVML